MKVDINYFYGGGRFRNFSGARRHKLSAIIYLCNMIEIKYLAAGIQWCFSKNWKFRLTIIFIRACFYNNWTMYRAKRFIILFRYSSISYACRARIFQYSFWCIWSWLPITYRRTRVSHSMSYQPLLSVAACKFSGSLCTMSRDHTTVSRSHEEWSKPIAYRLDRLLENNIRSCILQYLLMFLKCIVSTFCD